MTLRVDLHCHVGLRAGPCAVSGRFTFEPPDYAGYDAYFADPFFNSLGMRVARRYFHLSPDRGMDELNARIERTLLSHILGATKIDRAVILAFDQYHTDDGQAVGPKKRRQDRGTNLYVSNTYVRALCRRHPQRLLFGASIHPYRRTGGTTAIDCLHEVAEAGAVLIKWLPVVQNIDAEDRRTIDFLTACRRIGMPLLIHYGGEATLGRPHPAWEDPRPLLRVLRQLRDREGMPPVIIAHAATPREWPVGNGRYHHALVAALLDEFADAPLFADVSALALFARARWLRRLARNREIHPKLVYGSDFPIPPTPAAFRFQLGSRYGEIQRMRSWIDRDVAIKEALGFDRAVFERGGEILASRIMPEG